MSTVADLHMCCLNNRTDGFFNEHVYLCGIRKMLDMTCFVAAVACLAILRVSYKGGALGSPPQNLEKYDNVPIFNYKVLKNVVILNTSVG